MRKFLILLDDTPETLNAMRYAALRAAKTGGSVVMLAVISPEEFQHFMGVADVMRAEAREKVEANFELFKDRIGVLKKYKLATDLELAPAVIAIAQLSGHARLGAPADFAARFR